VLSTGRINSFQLALLAGVVLICSRRWLRWRGQNPPLPLVGPSRGDRCDLLIAGGFVLRMAPCHPRG